MTAKRTDPPAPPSEKTGPVDAAAVSSSFTPPEAPPEAPQKKRPSGAQQRKVRREKEAAALAAQGITDEEKQFWADQLKHLADAIREQRPWQPELTAAQALHAGEPLALTVKKYTPSAEERPEVVLLVVLAPWLVSVVRSELQHLEVQRGRQRAGVRPLPPRDERGAVRPEGVGEDYPGTETVGAPLPLPDH